MGFICMHVFIYVKKKISFYESYIKIVWPFFPETGWPLFSEGKRSNIDLTVRFSQNLTEEWRAHLTSRHQLRRLRGFRMVNLVGSYTCSLKISFALCFESAESKTEVLVSILTKIFFCSLYIYLCMYKYFVKEISSSQCNKNSFLL
jgi:hypothetical protein